MPWTKTVSTSAFSTEDVISVQAGKVWIALYHADGEYYASAVVCSHGQASLADGYLEEFLIECPLHQGTFDIRTGDPVSAPCTVPIRTFPVKVVDGIIHVEVRDDEV